MSALVHRVVKWLPPTWQAAIERESREWRARCPKCLRETSVWDMGGVRFKATGHPFRKLQCVHCQNTFLGQLYRVEAGDESIRRHANTENYASSQAVGATPVKRGWGVADGRPGTHEATNSADAESCRLWIDGVGCFQLVLQNPVVIGSPSSASAERPDVAVMAAISRRQVQITRSDEGYTMTPVDSAELTGGRRLRSGERFSIGGGVEICLRVPNPLSQTAVLETASGHRIEPRCNGVVLFDQVCVLGSGSDAHIRTPWGITPLILFRRGGGLWCKAVEGLQRNGEAVDGEFALNNGDVLTTEDLSLRLEMSCGS